MKQEQMPPIEAIVQMVCSQMTAQNATCEVSGERIRIPLEGRTLDAVYYPWPEKQAPMIFAFHGGGYVFGGCALNDGLYTALRDALKANIISIGYRKAPEFKFPVPQYDCYDAVKYLMECETYDFDRSRTAVYGGSAGAHASLAVTTLAAKNGGPSIKMRILTYPYGDAVTPPAEKPGVDPMEIPIYDYFNRVTVDENSSIPADDPLASPSLAPADALDPSIPTIAILGEKDSLRGDGEKIMQTLKAAGCQCECHVAKGMPHGYFEMGFASEDEDMSFLPPLAAQARADGSMQKMTDWTLELIKQFWNTYM